MNGLLIINKPKDYTSHDVVNIVRKKLNMKKVGHTGTLDPNATGVLPVLIGNATKISKYLIEHKKTYIATIELGKRTSTGDSQGKIIEEGKNLKEYTTNEIQNILKDFIGKQSQIPPMYSALKIEGKKLYEYAREGLKIEVKPREIEIYNIELIEYIDNIIIYKVECSKGTYIRTLSEDIAKSLGTIGYTKELERISVDEFTITESIQLDDLDENLIKDKIISIETIFKEKSNINLDDRKLELFLNGVQLSWNLSNGIYKIYNNNTFIGLGIIKDRLLKRDVII